MVYKKIKPQKMTEDELRAIWKETYCLTDIKTFDNVMVRFYEDMFDHAFKESANRSQKDKSILSLNRLEKIYWIREVLEDPEAILKQGWDTQRKEYYKDRRVAIVKDNYVVIIRFVGKLKAKFMTAYEKDDISNILQSPDFKRSEEFFDEV